MMSIDGKRLIYVRCKYTVPMWIVACLFLYFRLWFVTFHFFLLFLKLKNIIFSCVNIYTMKSKVKYHSAVEHSAGHCLLIPLSQHCTIKKKRNSKKLQRASLAEEKEVYTYSQLELSFLLSRLNQGKVFFLDFPFSTLHVHHVFLSQ